MDSATTTFQQNLPFAILPISPSFAALHSSRVHRLSPGSRAPNLPNCLKCGSFLFNGDGEVRARWRKKQRLHKEASSRTLRRTCRSCGWIDDIPVDRGNAVLFPSRKGAITSAQHLAVKVDVSGWEHNLGGSEYRDVRAGRGGPSSSPEIPHSALPITALPPARSKPRPKKRSGLHSMLSRIRELDEKEQLRRSEGQLGGGLVAFLNGL